MKKCVFLGFCLLIILNSCTTFNKRNPFPNMEVLQYEDTRIYEFKNVHSNKLIINIEGSGWTSVLGSKGENKWNWVGFGSSQLTQVLSDKYIIIIPEKWDWDPERNYWWDFNARVNYTFDNLLQCYLTGITGYLKDHNYSSIVLIGYSEGALLLPIIYENLKEKHNITGLVSYGFGGFSLHESYLILKSSPMVPEDQKQVYKYFYDMYEINNIDAYLTEKYFLSLMGIKPFDYYKNINIPILFIHGDLDINVPVESTIYIQENLTEKPFEFKYYHNMAHNPTTYSQIIDIRKKIAEWIINKNL